MGCKPIPGGSWQELSEVDFTLEELSQIDDSNVFIQVPSSMIDGMWRDRPATAFIIGVEMVGIVGRGGDHPGLP